MNRRCFLALSAAACLATALPGAARAQTPRYGGRLIDAHGHVYWDAFSDYDRLIELYEAAGVDGVWLFAHPWNLAADAAGKYPERVVPFLGEGYLNTLHPHAAYMNPEGLDQMLAAGVVRGLGEIILRHSAFQLGPEGGYDSAPATHVPADEPRLVEAYRVAGQHGVPVAVHQEWFFAAELERALELAPETAFVWAHAGHGPAGVVSELMERHPNLYADLSARTPWIGPTTVLLRADGQLDPVWRATLERFPDRFLVGFDLFSPAHYRLEYVRMIVEYYRGLLGQLPDDVAAMIGHANAERLAPLAAG